MDLIDLTKERPADFDIGRSQQLVFTGPEESISPSSVALVFYDESSCLEAYAGNEILKLIKQEKMQGVAVPIHRVKDMIVSMLDAYQVLMQVNSKMEDRLRIANRMSAILSDLKLM